MTGARRVGGEAEYRLHRAGVGGGGAYVQRSRAVGNLDALVAISQMTVSQMDALSMSESHHQRLHWLSEQVFNWSGLPMIHVRPTVFLDTGLFTTLAARSIAEEFFDANKVLPRLVESALNGRS